MISSLARGMASVRRQLDHDLIDALVAHAAHVQPGKRSASERPGKGRPAFLPTGPPASPPLMRYFTVVQGAKRMSSWSVPSRSAPFWLKTPITLKGTLRTRISWPMGYRRLEQLADQGLADQADLAAVVDLALVEGAAQIEVDPVAGFEKGGRAPRQVGGNPTPVAVDHLRRGIDDRRGADDVGAFALDGLGVVGRDDLVLLADAPDPRCGAPGMTARTLAPILVDGQLDGHGGAAADLHHGDHGRHADDHAQHRQQGPHHVAPQGLQGDPHGVPGHAQAHSASAAAAALPPPAARPPPWRRAAAAESSTICPSAMRITRSAWRATPASWVTSRTVMPLLDVQAAKELQDLLARARVEVPRRLVRQQHRGVVDQRAGDGHALLLAAGKLRRRVVHPRLQTHRGQQLPAPLRACCGRDTFLGRVGGRHPHVFQRRGAGQEIEALENKADAAAAKLRQLRGRQLVDLDAVEAVGAPRWAGRDSRADSSASSCPSPRPPSTPRILPLRWTRRRFSGRGRPRRRGDTSCRCCAVRSKAWPLPGSGVAIACFPSLSRRSWRRSRARPSRSTPVTTWSSGCDVAAENLRRHSVGQAHLDGNGAHQAVAGDHPHGGRSEVHPRLASSSPGSCDSAAEALPLAGGVKVGPGRAGNLPPRGLPAQRLVGDQDRILPAAPPRTGVSPSCTAGACRPRCRRRP